MRDSNSILKLQSFLIHSNSLKSEGLSNYTQLPPYLYLLRLLLQPFLNNTASSSLRVFLFFNDFMNLSFFNLILLIENFLEMQMLNLRKLCPLINFIYLQVFYILELRSNKANCIMKYQRIYP